MKYLSFLDKFNLTYLIKIKPFKTRCNSKKYSQDESNRYADIHPMNTHTRTLNNSIAILLRSYTQAINKQEKRSGALFREGTKADCINCFNKINPSFIKSDNNK